MAVHCFGEEPRRPAKFVELGKRSHTVEEQQRCCGGFQDIVADGRAPRHVDDRESQRGAVILAEVVHDPHGAGDIASCGRDSTPGSACSDGDDGRSPRRQPVEPLKARDLAAGCKVFAESHPVPGS